MKRNSKSTHSQQLKMCTNLPSYAFFTLIPLLSVHCAPAVPLPSFVLIMALESKCASEYMFSHTHRKFRHIQSFQKTAP